MKKVDQNLMSEPSPEDVRYTEGMRVDPLTTMDQMRKDLSEIRKEKDRREEEKKLADEKLRLQKEEELNAKLERLEEFEKNKRNSEDGTSEGQ